jgi:TM2 domain-containing membrane protein YozV
VIIQQVPGPPAGGVQVVRAESSKSKAVAALLAFFLGAFGIHNFYMGYTGRGVVQLLLVIPVGCITYGLTAWISAIWAFIEFILILATKYRAANGQPLS